METGEKTEFAIIRVCRKGQATIGSANVKAIEKIWVALLLCGAWGLMGEVSLFAQKKPENKPVPPTADRVPTQNGIQPADEPIVRAVQRALPAVVNINTEKVVVRTIPDPMDQLFNDFFRGPAFSGGRRMLQSVRSLGSGFFVDAAGYILTNEHVVERAADLRIQITLFDGRTYEGEYIYGDPDRDLALVRIKSSGADQEKAAAPFPFIPLDKLSPNLIGQTVIVLGNPIGFESSVSAGILSGKDRTVGSVSGLLQTDAAINPGNSGGPIVDITGALVGISSQKISYLSGRLPAESLGFAIPSELAAEWVREAMSIARGEKKPPGPEDVAAVLKQRIGLELQELTPELAQVLGFRMMVPGVLVSGVEEGSPAKKAGIEVGYILQSVGRYPTSGLVSLPRELGSIRPGMEVTLILVRALPRRGNVSIQEQVRVGVIAR
jgi:S1-C subfamily serine protease